MQLLRNLGFRVYLGFPRLLGVRSDCKTVLYTERGAVGEGARGGQDRATHRGAQGTLMHALTHLTHHAARQTRGTPRCSESTVPAANCAFDVGL